MPILFIGHGSPMNMVRSNPFTESLAALGRSLPRPAAILVISAHWLTEGTFVTCTERPRLIYDFYGFPPELYTVTYPCHGSASTAARVTELGGGVIRCDPARGLDHASYAILKHMYPDADIPVLEMSLDYTFGGWHNKAVRYHYELAQRLRPLRDEGVLIIGSGNMVHNLRLADFSDTVPPYGWAEEADGWLRSRLLAGEDDALIACPSSGRAASLAMPTLDHYLPMIYAIAIREKGEPLRFTAEGFQNASVSMRSFRIG